MATIRSEGQFNSIIYEETDSYRGTKTRWAVMMNAADMDDLGIETGDRVNLRSDNGKMEDVTAYAFDLPRGNVTTYYPEANVLTSTRVDPRSRTPSFKATPIWIERSTRGATA